MEALPVEFSAAGSKSVALPTECKLYGVYANINWSALVFDIRGNSVNMSQNSRAWTPTNGPYPITAGTSVEITATGPNKIVILYD